jgi:hypothetical protein
MWPTNWLRIESEFPELLTQCRGLRGEPWSYSTSHSQMLVRFYRDGSLAGIYLYCKNCESVQFRTSWLDANVRVEILEGPHGPVYTITDGDRLHIVCGAAFLAQSPDLIRLPELSI